MYAQLLQLLHRRFGEWFISIARSNVVKFIFLSIREACSTFCIKFVQYSLLLLKRFPFDYNNPIGYLFAVIVEYIIIGHEYFVIACTLGLGIGAFWFAVSATKEIRHTLNLINNEVKAKTNHSVELKILFSEFINAHATVKQLSMPFSKV